MDKNIMKKKMKIIFVAKVLLGIKHVVIKSVVTCIIKLFLRGLKLRREVEKYFQWYIFS